MVRPRHGNVVPGHHIYAYCNIKTQQVLYSLTRTLQHKQLQQLPDTGANNNPPKLRKDLWRPLWSLHLPETEDGAYQGLRAYKMLRDFRQLHEMSWEPPKSLSVPYTEKQIEKLEKRLEERGGSKKENAHDLIARRKWKMRTQMVMNQKANSIADLAAVLLHQDDRVESLLAKREKVRAMEVKEMEKLAELSRKDGGLARKELEKQISEWIAQRDARQQDRRWRKLNGKVDAGQLRLAKMEFAAYWVPQAKKEAEEVKRLDEEANATGKSQYETDNARTSDVSTEIPGGEKESAVEDAKPQQKPATWTKYLPSFPPELVREPLSASKTQLNPKDQLKPSLPPVYTPQGKGITVRWANTLDAEYAEMWPALVQHQPMGIVRHTAPRADDENPFLEIAEFKSLQWKSRRQGFPLEPTLAEKVQARRKELGMKEHPTLKNKFTRMEEEDVLEEAAAAAGRQELPVEEGEEEEVYDPAAVKAARQEQIEKLQAATLRNLKENSSNSRIGAVVDPAAIFAGEAAVGQQEVGA